MTLPLDPIPGGVALRVKVVPGASRTKVAGLLGDRLKVAVAAPPEGGKANIAVCELIADLFDLPRKSVVVAAGPTQPQKTLHLLGLSLAAAQERLTQSLASGR